MFDLSIKKKVVKKAQMTSKNELKDEAQEDLSKYQFLLDRIYAMIDERNPELASQKRLVLPPPKISRLGNKVLWGNFNTICDIMKRDKDHVMSFFMTELQTEVTMDSENNIILKAKYTKLYLQCSSCKLHETVLEKDPKLHLQYKRCKICNSSQCVADISAGYHAVTRADRIKQKNNA